MNTRKFVASRGTQTTDSEDELLFAASLVGRMRTVYRQEGEALAARALSTRHGWSKAKISRVLRRVLPDSGPYAPRSAHELSARVSAATKTIA